MTARTLSSILILSALALSGCGGSSDGAGKADPSPAFPTERNASSKACRGTLRMASLKTVEPDQSVGACDDVVAWLSSVEQYPAALGLTQGSDVTVDQLAQLCKGRDSAPVCADGIGRKLFEPSGDERALSPISIAANSCAAQPSLSADGTTLPIDTTGKGQHDAAHLSCVVEVLKAPDDVAKKITAPEVVPAQRATWGQVKAEWTVTQDGTTATFTWTK